MFISYNKGTLFTKRSQQVICFQDDLPLLIQLIWSRMRGNRSSCTAEPPALIGTRATRLTLQVYRVIGLRSANHHMNFVLGEYFPDEPARRAGKT
jgi:hypothetical protein